MGLIALLGVWIGMAPAAHAAETTVKIGQATTALSFLPIYAARALDTFPKQDLKLVWAAINGGDPATLAALDAGDIDLAAVGSETVLKAVAKGQPFEIVYSLMSKVTLQLVVSNEFLKRTGVSPNDPLEKRLAALKNALIGVSAIGGAQDAAARWLAVKGGLNPKTDIRIAKIGPPPAILAAMENQRIDGFVLSPPAGNVIEASKSGKVLVRLGDDFPDLKNLPFLVLVAKKPIDGAKRDLIVRSVRALQQASGALTAKPSETAAILQKKFFAKLKPEIIAAAIEALKGGVADGGRLDQSGFDHLMAFANEKTGGAGSGAKVKAGDLWTNAYVEAAQK
jgi:ABC-type nitrate/sulfonate/bicarbonate transport system substrate-binding protein